jgi:hypothetical protein
LKQDNFLSPIFTEQVPVQNNVFPKKLSCVMSFDCMACIAPIEKNLKINLISFVHLKKNTKKGQYYLFLSWRTWLSETEHASH